MRITRAHVIKVESVYFVKGGNLRAKVHYRRFDDEPVKRRVFNLGFVTEDWDDRAALCPAVKIDGFTASGAGEYYRLDAGAIGLLPETWQALGNRHVEGFISRMRKHTETFRRMGREGVAQHAIDEINDARARLGWGEKFEYTGRWLD